MPTERIALLPSGGGSMVLIGTIATPSGSELPGGGNPAVPTVTLKPVQVVGMIPMTDCDAEECRTFDQTCCYMNPVFGNLKPSPTPPFSDIPVDIPTYENDFNTWLVDYSALAKSGSDIFNWSLEKVVDGEWSEVVATLDNTYGKVYGINTITGHKYYIGLSLNWGAVLFYKGAGCYRVKVTSEIHVDDPTGLGSVSVITSCIVSECFNLLAWDCERAYGTVKFESNISGKIGDPTSDYLLHDLCGITWYDSIRFKGFIGFETVPEYLEVMNEFQTGFQQRIRDEAIQQYKLSTHPLPKWLHDRFKTFALMADTLMGSDYNRNNSDYDFKRRSLVKNGSYEPTYFDKNGLRRAMVEVNFRRGVQSVIKTACCCTSTVIDP